MARPKQIDVLVELQGDLSDGKEVGAILTNVGRSVLPVFFEGQKVKVEKGVSLMLKLELTSSKELWPGK